MAYLDLRAAGYKSAGGRLPGGRLRMPIPMAFLFESQTTWRNSVCHGGGRHQSTTQAWESVIRSPQSVHTVRGETGVIVISKTSPETSAQALGVRNSLEQLGVKVNTLDNCNAQLSPTVLSA